MGRATGAGPSGFAIDSKVRQSVKYPRLFGREEAADFLSHPQVFSHDLFAKGFAVFAHSVMARFADFVQLLLLLGSELEVIIEIPVRPEHHWAGCGRQKVLGIWVG